MLIVIAGLCVLGLPGTALATWSGRTGELAGAGHNGVYRVYPDGQFSAFFQATTVQTVIADPIYSPRGTRMADFQLSTVPGKTGLYIRRWDGSDPRLILSGGVLTPSWSPDGKWIIGAGLVLVPTDGSGDLRYLKPFGDPARNAATADPVWSTRGVIAFLADSPSTGVVEVFTMNADGSGVKQVTHTTPNGDCALGKASLGWSPDGTRLVFEQDVPDAAAGGCSVTQKIVVTNADGSHSRRIATGTAPLFSPDDQHLIYLDSDAALHEIAGDGSGNRALPALADFGRYDAVPTSWQSEPGTLTAKLTMGHTFTNSNPYYKSLFIHATVSPVTTRERITVTLSHLVAGSWVTVQTMDARTGPNGGFSQFMGHWFDGTCRAVLQYHGDPQYLPRADSIKFPCHP